MIEHINEAFISDTCINNLLKIIPILHGSFAFEKSLMRPVQNNVHC